MKQAVQTAAMRLCPVACLSAICRNRRAYPGLGNRIDIVPAIGFSTRLPCMMRPLLG